MFLINKSNENYVDGVYYCVIDFRIILVCTNNPAMMRFLRNLRKEIIYVALCNLNHMKAWNSAS